MPNRSRGTPRIPRVVRTAAAARPTSRAPAAAACSTASPSTERLHSESSWPARLGRLVLAHLDHGAPCFDDRERRGAPGDDVASASISSEHALKHGSRLLFPVDA